MDPDPTELRGLSGLFGLIRETPYKYGLRRHEKNVTYHFSAKPVRYPKQWQDSAVTDR
jgi:hypothetical protein